MPAITIDVAPTILSWVMNTASFGNSGNDIKNKIEAWINGEKKPTFNQIEKLSKKTHVPLGYFFLKTPPVENLPILNYRTVDSIALDNPSRDLIDTIYYLESIQEWMHDYHIDSGTNPLSFVASQYGVTQPKLIANAIRADIGLNADWYTEPRDVREAYNLLRKRLSDAGILILANGIVGSNTHRKLSIEEFRAVTLLDEYAPLVFINSNDTQSGKLFSLMHEAAHIWIGENSFYNDWFSDSAKVSVVETLCNAVTAEILVPSMYFTKQWNEITESQSIPVAIKALAKIFNCGTTIIARRALDNNFITQEQYMEVAREAIRKYQESKVNVNGGDYYITNSNRLDHNLIIAMDNSIKEGKTSYTDAYRLTNMSRKTFPALVEKVRNDDYVG